MWALHKHYQGYFSLTRKIGNGEQVARPMAWIDSIHRRRVLEEILSVTSVQGEGVLELKKATVRWLATPWLSSNQIDMEE